MSGKNVHATASLLNEALDKVPAGLGIFDFDGKTVRQIYLNDGFYQMIGAQRNDRSQFYDAGTIESVHPDDRAGLLDEAKASLRENRTFEYRFRNLSGDGASYIWIGITASHERLDAKTERFYAAYFDVDGYIDDRMRDRDRYERALEDVVTAVPGSAGIVHIDLTENRFRWTHKPYASFAHDTEGGTWDDLVRLVIQGVPDEDAKRELRKFECDRMVDAFRKGVNYLTSDYRRRGENGKPRWISSRAYMLRNPDNDHIECVAYTQDISAERLRNQVFRIITSRSFDLVALIHLDDRTFEAVYLGETLPNAYRRLLPKPGAICGFDAFCAESTRHIEPEAVKDYEARLSSDYIRGEISRNGGSYEFMQKSYFEDKGDGPVYRRLLHYRLDDNPDTILVIESDVTTEIAQQQKRTAKVLASAERDRLIMDSIMGAICILKMDDNGHLSVDYFNSYVFEMLGYEATGLPRTAADAKGTPTEPLFADALSFIHPDDQAYVSQVYREHRDDESFELNPYRMFGSDGRPQWVKVKVRSGGVSHDGRFFYVAMHDVTQEVKLQEELAGQVKDERRLRKEADAANAAKTDFLSRMSHDIRTPLNGVIGMSYLARQEDNPPNTNEYLAKIDTSAKFLLGLINDVLDMAKMESGKIELHPEPYPIDEFHEYLDAVIKPLCREKGPHFRLDEDIPADVWPLVDKSAINQVIFNLLSNAVKFTPEGGTITYRVRGKAVKGNRIALEHQVIDTGIGMSAEFRKKIFEPFSQEGRDDVSENRGSGLGLAIVKRLVDLMGGTIAVDSTLGQGSVFTVDIELDTVERRIAKGSSDMADHSRSDDANLRGMHVLLCEDHPLNQEISRALLQGKGALVDVAGDGRAGLEMFERSTPGFYGAVLMDVRMPVMGGLEATRAIRSCDRADAATVPIIAMTADAFQEDVQKCLDAGMNSHIAKPVDPSQLFSVLSAYADSKDRVDE